MMITVASAWVGANTNVAEVRSREVPSCTEFVDYPNAYRQRCLIVVVGAGLYLTPTTGASTRGLEITVAIPTSQIYDSILRGGLATLQSSTLRITLGR